jgi:hypothetical protein
MVLKHAPFRIPGVIAALLLGAATLSSAKPENEILRKGSTDGIFVGIEQEDYAHFQIKNNTGKEESYFLLHSDKSSEAISIILKSSKTEMCAGIGRKRCRRSLRRGRPCGSGSF